MMNDQSAALYFRMVVILQSFGDEIQMTLNTDRLKAVQAATQKEIALAVSSTGTREDNARLRLEMLSDCVNRLKFGLGEARSAAPPPLAPARNLSDVFADHQADRKKAIAARIIAADILFKALGKQLDAEARPRLRAYSADRQREAKYSFWPKDGLPDRKNIDAACEHLLAAKYLAGEGNGSPLAIGEKVAAAFRLIGVYRRDAGFIVGHEVSWEITDILKRLIPALLKELPGHDTVHMPLFGQTLAVVEEIKALG